MYLGDFENQANVESEFKVELGDNEKILLAVYTNECYEGAAFVLLQDLVTGLLYEVNSSHCSCYGLEDTWDLEATSVQSLRNRMKDGNVGPFEFDITEELEKVLAAL
jgi:hypothetical protein